MESRKPRLAIRMCALGLLLLAAWPLLAQPRAGDYRQQLLAIQQRIEAGDLTGARTLLTAALVKYPADGGLENLLGVLEIQQGHEAEARELFRAALKHSPRLASAAMNLSRLDMQSAATDKQARAEAFRLSRQVLLAEPGNDEARNQLAALLLWQGEPRQALVELNRLSPAARRQPQVQALGCAAQAVVGPAEATTQSAAALIANPALTEQDAETCMPALRQARRADLIAALYSAAAARQPLSPAGQRTLGLAQEAAGKLTEARATLEAAFTASAGKSAVLLIDLTRIAEAAGDNQGALGYLAHARDLRPDDPDLPYEFGSVCLKLGFFGEARKAFTEAVRLAPERPESNYALGSVISFSQDPSQAMPYLEKYHSLKPDAPNGLLALGVTSFRSKDYEAAKRWLAQAALVPRTAADAHYYLGRIARQENRTADAVAELKLALPTELFRADVLAELGQIATSARNYTEAADDFNRALAIDPDSYTANFGLLQLYARTGDSRREEQSKRFDQIKDKKEERDSLMMRVIEIQKDDQRPGQQP
jgi:tetratricopeptide (TPR) repeat protein